MKPSTEVVEVASRFALDIGWGTRGQQPPHRSGPRLKDDSAERRREQLKAIFQKWDTDGNGKLNRKELTAVLSRLGKMTTQDIGTLMDEADKNKDGMIDVEEFVDWLAGGQKPANVIVEYGDALRPIFAAFDKQKRGVITYENFIEVHGILHGALSLFPEGNEDQRPFDPMMLRRNADEAFQAADRNGDKNISFADFATYMHSCIVQSGVSKQEFEACAAKLASALQHIYAGIEKAERGEIREKDSFILRRMVEELAGAARDLEHSLEESHTEEEVQVDHYVDPPKSLSIVDLKMMHMKCHPVNFRLVDSVEIMVICVPKMVKAGKCKWISELTRELTFKTGTTSKDMPHYYEFDPSVSSWQQLLAVGEGATPAAMQHARSIATKAAGEEFVAALKALAPEIGLFYVLKTQADFGTELDWDQVRDGLIAGVDIGWLSTSQRVAFNEYMTQRVLAQKAGDKTTESLSKTQADALVADFLHRDLKIRPREVMAILSKLGFLKVDKAWRAFMRAV